jgi:uncharacterized membrane protein YuzA (DUF378 family)
LVLAVKAAKDLQNNLLCNKLFQRIQFSGKTRRAVVSSDPTRGCINFGSVGSTLLYNVLNFSFFPSFSVIIYVISGLFKGIFWLFWITLLTKQRHQLFLQNLPAIIAATGRG